MEIFRGRPFKESLQNRNGLFADKQMATG